MNDEQYFDLSQTSERVIKLVMAGENWQKNDLIFDQ
jgi:hypothetical protein